MRVNSRIVRLFAASLLCGLAACGGSGDSGDSDDDGGTPPVPTTVGPAGGTVQGPMGTSVEIPAGALATETAIAIELASAGAPPLPAGLTAAGQTFAFLPHGTTFTAPVTITVPFDPAAVPASATAALLKSNAAQTTFAPVPGATANGGTMTAQVTSFSFILVGNEPLLRDDPLRQWQFSTFRGEGTSAVPVSPLFTQVGGDLLDNTVHDYGAMLLPVRGDQTANGEVFSNATGKTYWVLAQAPLGSINDPDSQIGSLVRFEQAQSFTKLEEGATLELVITKTLLEAINFNPTEILPFDCVGRPACKLGMEARIDFRLIAYSAQAGNFNFNADSFVSLQNAASQIIGGAERWRLTLANRGSDAIWGLANFAFDPDKNDDGGTSAEVSLRQPITISIDLSEVDVLEEFSVRMTVLAKTFNQEQGESYVSAFFRDPVNAVGGTLEFTGLQPTNNPLPEPEDTSEPAPECTTGTDPQAGALQFSAAAFEALEVPVTGQPIVVTRTGGSRGAVSAVVTTADGTAIAGTHYTAVTRTVTFGAGDSTPRAVEVPLLPDTTPGDDRTVNLALSDVRGCAALGAPSAAVLTILDNDRPPVALPSGLDLAFGTEGEATSPTFGGDRSAMALQADGKIVMVGGTFTDFILARFNADGSLDNDFGAEGKVTTDMGSGLRSEEALGVAVQPDGKIVVVGYTSLPNIPPAPRLPDTFALARYNGDGSLDTGFGAGGKVSGNVNGRAFAVSIQDDGKIVVAGEFSFDSTNGNDFGDFTVARFDTNGNLDASFGSSGTGQVVTDIGLSTNAAQNLVLQSDGAIVVSGKPQGSAAGFDHTDVVRYNANGSLDDSFGGDGKVTLPGLAVGDGLALQRDGKLVLVGSIEKAVPPATSIEFAVMRLNADGSVDEAFGEGNGIVTTGISGRGDAARAVALQDDGKILVAGGSNQQLNSNFAVARYDTDGTLDATFGNDGTLTVDFSGSTDIAETVAVQPDGKIVLGGLARDNVDGYGLARVLP